MEDLNLLSSGRFSLVTAVVPYEKTLVPQIITTKKMSRTYLPCF